MMKQTLVASASSIALLAALPLVAAKPAKRSIYEVKLVGDPGASQKQLLAKLSARKGKLLQPSTVAADVRALWASGKYKRVRAELEERGGKLVLHYLVEPRARLRTIGVSGNHLLSQAQVVKVARLKLNAPLSGATVAAAAETVRQHYRNAGYAAVNVDYELSESPTRDDAAEPKSRATTRSVEGGPSSPTGHARLIIREGPRFRVGQVRLHGSPGKHRARLEALMRRSLRRGAIYDPRAVDRLAFALGRALRDHGHIYAQVTPMLDIGAPAPKPEISGAERSVEGGSIDSRRRRAAVTFAVALGGRARIETVRIRGNTKTRDRVIRRELTFSPGDYYSDAALIATRRRITGLGFFEAVDITPLPGSDPGLVQVEIAVKERKTGQFQLGAGFSSAEGFIASARIVQQNLFGRGQTLGLSAQLSALRQLFDVRFTDPRVFDSDYSFSASLYNTRRIWPGFTHAATGGSLTLGRPLGSHTHAYLTYRLEHAELSNIGGDPFKAGGIGPLFRAGLTSSLRATLVHDTRDDRLFPTDGTHAGVYTEIASRALGSDNQFTRVGGWYRKYRHLAGPFRLRFNAEAGLITSRDPFGAPLGERFQLGGITDVRGFAPGGIGPRLSIISSDPTTLTSLSLGGNLRLLSNTELEFTLSRKLGIDGVLFFDIGNVFNLEPRYCSVGKSSHSDTLCPGSLGDVIGGLRKSVGFGFRWRSPIGPLRFEWGIPLDRRPGEAPIRFHFSVGTSF